MSNTEELRATFDRWLRDNGHCEDQHDDMLMPLQRSLNELMWSAWRAALAQPAASGEPVAWFCEWFNADGSPEWDQYHDRTDPVPADDEWEDRPPDRVTPLYATPHPAPARVPLTDEQIQTAWDSVDMRHPRGDATRNAFARAIEAAHGITAKEAP